MDFLSFGRVSGGTHTIASSRHAPQSGQLNRNRSIILLRRDQTLQKKCLHRQFSQKLGGISPPRGSGGPPFRFFPKLKKSSPLPHPPPPQGLRVWGSRMGR